MSKKIKLIIPCEVRIDELSLQLNRFVEKEDYEAASRIKNEIDELKKNPQDEIIECKPTTVTFKG